MSTDARHPFADRDEAQKRAADTIRHTLKSWPSGQLFWSRFGWDKTQHRALWRKVGRERCQSIWATYAGGSSVTDPSKRWPPALVNETMFVEQVADAEAAQIDMLLVHSRYEQLDALLAKRYGRSK